MQEIIGFERVSYTNKAGRDVEGTRVFLSRPVEQGFGAGCVCQEIYISASDCADIRLGPIVTPIYVPGFSGRPRCTGFIYPEKGGDK